MKINNLQMPPISNRGGRDSETATAGVQTSTAAVMEKYSQVFIDHKGRVIEMPLRRGIADSAFIDAISFTIHESSLSRGVGLVSDDEFIAALSLELLSIFGFGISFKADGKGGRFYDSCYILGDYQCMYGRVHFGGQNDTILVEILGVGCQAATENWEGRLYDFLNRAIRPKISRIDIAKDFLQGEYSPDQAKIDWETGAYNKRGKRPIAECIGTDWLSDTKKGKTFAIGSRQSACYIRVYDKAKQMGDINQAFCRVECEFKGRYCVIPFDVLLCCGQFFGGAAPALEHFAQVPTSRVNGLVRILETSIDKVIKVSKNQCGRSINMLLRLGKNPKQIIDLLKAPQGLLPNAVRPDQFAAEHNDFMPIHERMAIRADIDFFGMCLE